MELWPELIQKINTSNIHLKLETPLIQLANGVQEIELMKKLISEKGHLGLHLIKDNMHNKIKPSWPNNQYGGLISNKDGRIDPLNLLKSLIIGLKKLKVSTINSKALALKRLSQMGESKWKIILENNSTITKDMIIICSALGTPSLLKSIGYEYSIDAVLGQVLELVIEEEHQDWENWPSVLNTNGINIIPQKQNKILLGATLEPGIKPSMLEVKKMQELNGSAPTWIKNADINNYWYGVRARPKSQPAPLLDYLEPGLILNTAHYRNGVLLAPACAEWVAKQIKF